MPSLRPLPIIVAAALLAPAGSARANDPASQPLTGKVVQSMDAGNYTYAEIEADGRKVWVAAPRTPVAAGETVSVPAGMVMKNFSSKSLDRTFEEVWFVASIKAPGAAAAPAPGAAAKAPEPIPAHRGNGASPKTGALVAAIARVADGYTVAELYAQKADLAGKPVAVRGKVTKYNAAILGKNWLHIDDGSGAGKDLTVTTAATAKVGDTVVVRGVLGTDRDFGAGYRYDLIIEDAVVSAE